MSTQKVTDQPSWKDLTSSWKQNIDRLSDNDLLEQAALLLQATGIDATFKLTSTGPVVVIAGFHCHVVEDSPETTTCGHIYDEDLIIIQPKVKLIHGRNG